MELTPKVVQLRLNIERLLSRDESALLDNGLLPNGEGVASYVNLDGSVDIERIRGLCGDGVVERVEDFLRADIQNPPWSGRTREAQLRAAGNNGVSKGMIRSIRRGPGRYSLR